MADEVTLYVFGLKSVVATPVTAIANLDSTWYNFLNNVCGIQVSPRDSVMACTTSYSVPAKRGWSANLNEKIRSFVDKFAVKKGRYSVRLMMQLTPPPADSNEEEQEQEVQQVNSRESNSRRRSKSASRKCSKSASRKRSKSASRKHSNSASRRLSNSPSRQMPGRSATKRRYTEVDEVEPVVTRRPSSSRIAKKNRSSYPIIGSRVYRNGGVVVEEEVEDDYPANEPVAINQQMSLERERESNHLPDVIPVVRQNQSRSSKKRNNHLKPVVKDRFQRFSNAFLLLVNNEITKLQRNRLWDRNVLHSPLACYLLQELFQD